MMEKVGIYTFSVQFRRAKVLLDALFPPRALTQMSVKLRTFAIDSNELLTFLVSATFLSASVKVD